MKENGKTIFNMDKEKKPGLMAQYMKETMFLERNKDSEFTVGTMDHDMKEIGTKTR